MQSFLNDPQLKKDLLAEVEKHRLADDFVAGTYGKELNGRFVGCVVGCSIESLNRIRGKKFRTWNHKAYEDIGIPEWLAKVQDVVYEGLPSDRKSLWAEQSWKSMPVGINLDRLKDPFMILVLRSTYDTFDHQRFPNIKSAIDRVIELYEVCGSRADFKAAYKAVAAAGNAVDFADADADDAYTAAYLTAHATCVAHGKRVAHIVYVSMYAARESNCIGFADELLRLFREG